MKKASSSLLLFVLFVAVATQANSQTPYGQQGGGAQGSFDPNWGHQGSAQGGYGQQGSAQGGYGQQGSAQGGYGHQGSAQGGYSPSQLYTQRISQQLRMREVRRISELLRLTMTESMDLEASSITLSASAFRNQAQIEISSRGRLISTQLIRRHLGTVSFYLPTKVRLDDLEISASDDVLLDTITVLAERAYRQPQVMQPVSGQMLRLDVRQDIRFSGEIHLKHLIKQQLGLSLEGVQIERIAVEGITRGRSATVQVELNGRPVGPIKTISAYQGITPIPLNSYEEVRGTLRLLVRGDVSITSVHIRVGQVRRSW